MNGYFNITRRLGGFLISKQVLAGHTELSKVSIRGYKVVWRQCACLWYPFNSPSVWCVEYAILLVLVQTACDIPYVSELPLLHCAVCYAHKSSLQGSLSLMVGWLHAGGESTDRRRRRWRRRWREIVWGKTWGGEFQLKRQRWMEEDGCNGGRLNGRCSYRPRRLFYSPVVGFSSAVCVSSVVSVSTCILFLRVAIDSFVFWAVSVMNYLYTCLIPYLPLCVVLCVSFCLHGLWPLSCSISASISPSIIVQLCCLFLRMCLCSWRCNCFFFCLRL